MSLPTRSRAVKRQTERPKSGMLRDPAQTATCTGGRDYLHRWRDYLHTVRFYMHNNLRCCLHANLNAQQIAILLSPNLT